jgi:hypothetical protein
VEVQWSTRLSSKPKIALHRLSPGRQSLPAPSSQSPCRWRFLRSAAAFGFSVVNPWSHASAADTTKAATVAGIYLTATAVLASAVGGYLAGRLRSLWQGTHPHEVFFRDTAHGLTAWAVAAVAGAVILGSAGTKVTGGAAREATAAAIDHRDISAALSDRLFAPAHPADAAKYVGVDSGAAARSIAAMTRPDQTIGQDDRTRLATLVSARTGLSMGDAEKRVDAVEADARQAAETARRVAMIISFWLVAAMFAGALAASLAAWEGGAVRDGRLRYGA